MAEGVLLPRTVPAAPDGPIGVSGKTYRPDVDGLRAIAVTSVVMYHAGLQLFRGGFVGVDIFFVISGYLIGGHVYRDVRRGKFSLAEFYRLRAKRILPALFAVLLFCYVASILLLSSTEMKSFAQFALATLGSASNVLAWLKTGYFNVTAEFHPLLMTWSLGVEEQFYVIFPLCMMFFGRARRGRVIWATLVITLLSLGLSVYGVHTSPTPTFYLLPTRAWELSVGILLALYETDRAPEALYLQGRRANITGPVGLALLAIGVCVCNEVSPFSGVAVALAVAGAAMLIASPGSVVNRLLLSSRPFAFVGLISYSWYLWHWPLLSFARIVADRPIPLAEGIGIGVISLPLAWASYRFIEQPFRQSDLSAGKLLRRYALASCVLAIPALLLLKAQGWPGRFPG